MQFEWDTAKAASNLAKHGVTFDQGTRVFADPACLTIIDPRHADEVRENTTGLVAGVILLTVTHTDRAGVTRLIFAEVSRSENCGQTLGGQQATTVPARSASRNERKAYHAAR